MYVCIYQTIWLTIFLVQWVEFRCSCANISESDTEQVKCWLSQVVQIRHLCHLATIIGMILSDNYLHCPHIIHLILTSKSKQSSVCKF